MIWKTKTFEELSCRELYGILQLRSQVFIVEQGGRYQDLDGLDLTSIHIFCENEEGRVVGCLRIFPKEGEPGTVQIGRVADSLRGQGVGARLMALAAEEAAERWKAKALYLTGRPSALGFYRKCGYEVLQAVSDRSGVLYYELGRRL